MGIFPLQVLEFDISFQEHLKLLENGNSSLKIDRSLELCSFPKEVLRSSCRYIRNMPRNVSFSVFWAPVHSRMCCEGTSCHIGFRLDIIYFSP